MPDYFLAIRWLHVASMAVLLGGATHLWLLTLGPARAAAEPRALFLLAAARAYEWLFWLAIGLLVLTGVGNLGAFGREVPGSATPWGQRLAAKLLAVGALMLLSLLRTMLIAQLSAPPAALSSTAVGRDIEVSDAREPSATPAVLSSTGLRVVQGFYATTALVAAAILLLAVTLAHA